MTFEGLRNLTEDMPTFTTRDVVTLSGQDASSVAVSLSRWVQCGRIERLRRGLYTLQERERQTPLSPAYLASVLVEPSYLSGLWLLAQNSIIPEAVFTLTSASLGRKLRFENAYGRFSYHRLPERAWFGYTSQEFQGYYLLLADSEKALLDAIYWSGTRWDRQRFRQERVDGNHLNLARLSRYAARWGEGKLKDSLEEFKAYKEEPCLTW